MRLASLELNVQEQRLCPSCKTELPAEAPEGLCIPCQLRRGAEEFAETSGVTEHPGSASLQTPAPKRIGSYIVQRILGRGGMGVVYLALDPRIKRYVAIKALPKRYAEDPEWTARLTREAEILGRLQHPHIAVIYERLDVEGEGSYLVLEYIEGHSLRKLLRNGPLEVLNVLQISLQIASALEAAHHRNIIHRDIKPENIQVTSEFSAKVLDFGLAVFEAPAMAAQNPASAIRVIPLSTGELPRPAGTPGYMSPEQARGRSVDRRTDIFSFGCVMFEGLTGRPAFDGPSVQERMQAVFSEEPDWSLLPRDTPHEIGSLLRHCLEKNLTDRLRDIADARWSIETALGERTETPLPTPSRETPHNLPVNLLSFVGREEAIARLSAALVECRLLTLVGAGGCGKTSLAIQVGFNSLTEYPHGVWFVDLSGADQPLRVPEVISATLAGTPRQAEIPNYRPTDAPQGASGPKLGPEERAHLENVKKRIGKQKALLILDNCEHLLVCVAAVIDELLRACPELRVLATSREVIGLQAEQVYFMPSLTLPGQASAQPDEELLQSEAVRLFIERARLVRPSFAPRGTALAAIAAVCQRLDGIPLAIELAASRTKMLSPQQILDRLSDRFAILTGGAQSAPPRHRTLRAALDWSFRLLSEEDRLSLHRLQVFVGGWTLEAAAAVVGTRESMTLDLLTRLVDKSFIVADACADSDTFSSDVRYRMHESIREYLRIYRGDDANSPSVSQLPRVRYEASCAHLRYFAALAGSIRSEIQSNPSEAFRQRVLKESDNFLSAQRFALETGSRLDIPISKDLRAIWKALFGPPEPSRRAQPT